MPEMYGLAALAEGLQAGQQAQYQKTRQAQETQLFELSLEEGQLKVKDMEFKFNTAKQLADAQVKAGKMIQAAEAKASASPGQDMLTTEVAAIEEASHELFKQGQFAAGTELLSTANALVSNNYNNLKRAREIASEKAERVTSLLQGVNDPTQFKERVMWDAANHPNDPLDPRITGQIMNFPYNPQDPASQDTFLKVRNNLIAAGQTLKDRADIAFKISQTEKSNFETEVLYPGQNSLNAAKEAHERELADRDRKTGKLDLVPQALVTESTASLKAMFPLEAALNPATLQRLAVPIAEDVRDMLQDNPGMRQSDAIARSIKQREKGQDFVGLRKGPVPTGTSAAAPAAMPMKEIVDPITGAKKNVPDPSKMKDKEIYNVAGTSMYYDAASRKLIPVTTETTAPPPEPTSTTDHDHSEGVP